MDKNVGSRIQNVRKGLGLSQDVVAGKLGISRQSYIQTEKGEREISVNELEKLAQIFNVSIYDFFEEKGNENKFKEMYLFVLSKFKEYYQSGEIESEGIAKTKLAKLLYLCDFRNFYEKLEPITGVQYIRREYGPVPDLFFRITDEMSDSGEIIEKEEVVIDYATKRISLPEIGEDYDYKELSKEEKDEISEICDLWKGKTVRDIVNFTHAQKPWKSCLNGEPIPYELIIQEDPKYVYKPTA
ncbi:MAG: DUF4065 domain-containing protein [Candidatus Ancillula sp.]|jgi:transcriptional regulator with XRE-family HTH domain|nr:DUF4065 domain-containing protein [Candidatus Ancillula sp.]